MATNLNIRLQLKYDSFENWEKVKESFIPLKGEVCIVNPGTSLSNRTDTPCLMKVGNGQDKFVDLPWLSALAADVHSWAKKTADEFTKWATDDGKVYADSPKLATQAQVATVASNLSTLSGKVTTAEGKITTLETTVNGNGTTENPGLVNRVTTLENEMNSAEDRLGVVEAALGLEGEGTESISARLKALEDSDDAQDSKITANENAHKANKEAIDVLNGSAEVEGSVDKKVADAVKVEADRAKAAEKVNSDAIAVLNGDAQTDGSVAKAVAAEAAARESAVGAVDTKVENLSDVVDGVKGTADAADALSKANKAAIDVLNGITAEDATGDAGKSVRTIANEELAAQLIPENAAEALDSLQEIAAWIQDHPGDAAEMNEKINTNASNITAINNTIGTVAADKTVVGLIEEGDAAQKTYTDGQIGALRTELQGYADDKAASAQTKAEATAKQYTDGEITKVTSTITALDGRVGAVETKATNNATAIADEKTRAEGKEGELAQAIATEKTRAEGEESKLSKAIADEAARADAAEKANASDIVTLQQKALMGTLDTSKTNLTIALNGETLDLILNCGDSGASTVTA